MRTMVQAKSKHLEASEGWGEECSLLINKQNHRPTKYFIDSLVSVKNNGIFTSALLTGNMPSTSILKTHEPFFDDLILWFGSLLPLPGEFTARGSSTVPATLLLRRATTLKVRAPLDCGERAPFKKEKVVKIDQVPRRWTIFSRRGSVSFVPKSPIYFGTIQDNW
ncbi:hypothetical protein K432DRAFT_391560 [Lepidopterella palustris CBS 459.81]|uniref:Uncharacterized protein n=1 Tax=Lepidopterella palustris CBS 459.81 TaxID=1314670 RepID=A0A8E2EDY2_9PEZI|nr:hypothetical protein K432DRAFT_391560 [Lepidopterella palustris CBS 459.81]